MKPELNTDEMPEYWTVAEDPYRVHSDVRVLSYYGNGDDSDPTGIVSVEPMEAEPPTDYDGEWVVEVQDADGDGVWMNYLNPCVVREEFDDLSDAYERVVELSKEYPIQEQGE